MWNPLIFGFVLLGLCISTQCKRFGVPPSFGSNQNDQLLVPGSKRTSDFVNATGLTSFAYFYLFSVINPEEFLESQSRIKPILKEVGPFRFKEQTRVHSIYWNESAETKDEVRVFLQKLYFYDGNRELLNEKITTLNAPLAVS